MVDGFGLMFGLICALVAVVVGFVLIFGLICVVVSNCGCGG